MLWKLKAKASRAAQLLSIALLVVSATSPAQAQDYPQRTVRLVVPYAPGAGMDILARVFADGFTRRWKQPMIVENRAGAAGVIGTDAVVRAAPDGHTLLFSADAPITSTPHLLKTKPYDPLQDLAPVSLLVKTNLFVVVNPAVSASNLRELVALAKQRPNELTYASIGPGSSPHLLFEALRAETGSQIRHIPYKASNASSTATVTGEVHMSSYGASSIPLIRAGKLKAIAVCVPNRLPVLPDVATCAEAGFSKIDPSGWAGILAPAGTPAALISRIQADAVDMLNSLDFGARGYETNAYSKVGSTPAEFARFIREDYEFKARMIRNAGIVPE